MKHYFSSIFLSLFVTMYAVSFSSNAEGILHEYVVYLGVENASTQSKNNKSNFTHQFFLDGRVYSYALQSDEHYTLENILNKGYIYDITILNQTVTGVQSSRVISEGFIEDFVTNSIQVNGTMVSLPENSKNLEIFEINFVNGSVVVFESSLEVGDSVKIFGNPVEKIYKTMVPEPYTAPVSGTPGVTSIKNFLATAMEPVGTTLYVYGGGWDFQDLGSSLQATTIGLYQTWVDFFQSQNINYTYRNNNNLSDSYYPHNGWNQYYYAGLDCSGYVGWAVYNTMHKESGGLGYVGSSTSQAKNLAYVHDYGNWSQQVTNFRSGDIFSMNGHVWICVGVCNDGSLVILHSTPSASFSGNEGGGVQLSGVGSHSGCEAVELADYYMQTYYPQWSSRYQAVYKSFSSYTGISGSEAGKFSWWVSDSFITDEEGYRNMTAGQILEDLFFKEENILPENPKEDLEQSEEILQFQLTLKKFLENPLLQYHPTMLLMKTAFGENTV